MSTSGASPWGVIPSTVAIAAGTEPGSLTDASSTSQTPSGNSSGQLGADLDRQPGLADATDAGQRDQPVAPHQLGDVADHSFAPDRPSSAAAAGCRSTASTLRSTGKSDGSPSATTWYTDHPAAQPAEPVLTERSQRDAVAHAAPRSSSETSTCPPCAIDISRAARFTSLPK